LVATASVSLLFMLVGLGRLLVGAPGDSTLVSLVFVAISLGAMPLWCSAVFRKDAPAE
jgi:hypothetical protein